MSAERTRLDELADERLDGLLDDAAWEAARTQHGEALDEALDEAQELRAAVGGSPRPALPPTLRARILASTAEAPDGEAASSAPPSGRPAWWLVAAPALLAAALVIAVGPLLLDGDDELVVDDRADEEPVAAGSEPVIELPEESAAGGAGDRDLAMTDGLEQDRQAKDRPDPLRSGTTDRQAGALPEPESADEVAVAEELADHMVEGSARDRTQTHTQDAREPTARKRRRDDFGDDRRGTVDGGGVATDAVAAADAVAAPAAPPHAEEDEKEEAAFAALAEEAREFQRRREAKGEAAEAEDAGAMPAEVTRQALANELARRDLDQAALEAAEQDGAPAGAAAEAPVDGAATSLAITMGLVPGDRPDAPPELDILMRNHGAQALPVAADLLTLEGIDRDGEVVWTAPIAVPEAPRVLAPGDPLRWRVPLTGERLPPAGVTALRLAGGGQRGDLLPLE